MNDLIVVINGRPLVSNNNSGVQKWSKQFCSALERELTTTGVASSLVYIMPSRFFRNGYLGHLWEQLILPFRFRLKIGRLKGAKQKRFLLINLGNWAPVCVKRKVVVIHDVLPIEFPRDFTAIYVWATKYLLKIVAKTSDKVFTVSEYSKNAIENLLFSHSRKAIVVASGPGIDKRSSTPLTKDNHFLFVGGDNPRKNLLFLISVWKLISEEDRPKLIVVGHVNRKILELCETLTKSVEFRSGLSDDEMSYLYVNARAVLHCSKGEGFGLPLLEACYHRVPFLSTDVGIARSLLTSESQILKLEEKAWVDNIKSLISGKADEADTVRWREIEELYNWKNSVKKFLANLGS